MIRFLHALAAAGVALLLTVEALPAAAAGLADEYQVKAAFIYNLAKFIEWPGGSSSGKDAPLTVCIAGRDPFGPAWANFEGRQVQGRALQVRRGTTLSEAPNCQVLYIAESEESRMAALLNAVGAAPVLTLSDLDGFAESGGAVGLVVEDGRLHFDANMASLHRAGLKASSQVLKLARNVYGMARSTRQ